MLQVAPQRTDTLNELPVCLFGAHSEGQSRLRGRIVFQFYLSRLLVPAVTSPKSPCPVSVLNEWHLWLDTIPGTKSVSQQGSSNLLVVSYSPVFS